jgi:hypothetical protein
MPVEYLGTIDDGEPVLTQVESGYDEWGNFIETATYMKKGNVVASVSTFIGELTSMVDDLNILSRTATYDWDTNITTINQTKVLSYASPVDKRISLESQSGREPITAHPSFPDIAGTPEEPDLTNAVWVKADDAQETMRFVEFRGEYAGLEQFISGSGTLLRVQWIDLFENVGFDDRLGKIEFPAGIGIWGSSTGWLLVGVTSEPFGSQAKHSKTYRLASTKASRQGGWNEYFYG